MHTGISHEQLKDIFTPLLAHIPAKDLYSAPTHYHGGKEVAKHDVHIDQISSHVHTTHFHLDPHCY